MKKIRFEGLDKNVYRKKYSDGDVVIKKRNYKITEMYTDISIGKILALFVKNYVGMTASFCLSCIAMLIIYFNIDVVDSRLIDIIVSILITIVLNITFYFFQIFIQNVKTFQAISSAFEIRKLEIVDLMEDLLVGILDIHELASVSEAFFDSMSPVCIKKKSHVVNYNNQDDNLMVYEFMIIQLKKIQTHVEMLMFEYGSFMSTKMIQIIERMHFSNLQCSDFIEFLKLYSSNSEEYTIDNRDLKEFYDSWKCLKELDKFSFFKW